MDVGNGVEWGWGAIDDDEAGTAPFGEDGKLGGGVDDEGAADDEHEIAVAGGGDGTVERFAGEGFAEEDGGGAEGTTADLATEFAFGGHEAGLEGIGGPFATAVETTDAVSGAVELDDAVGSIAGLLVETVDVLGDDMGKEARTFEGDESEMPGIGLGGGELVIAGAAVFPVLASGFGVLQEIADGGGCIALPDTARTAVIGDPRFGADPGAGESDDAGRVGDQLDEGGQGAVGCGW